MTSPDWTKILADIDTGLQAAKLGAMAAAAFGVPDAVVVEPLVTAAEEVVQLVRKLRDGNLTPLAAAVQAADDQAQVYLDEKFPPGKP